MIDQRRRRKRKRKRKSVVYGLNFLWLVWKIRAMLGVGPINTELENLKMSNESVDDWSTKRSPSARKNDVQRSSLASKLIDMIFCDLFFEF
ncbi:MAG: hypothetical protein Q8P67_10655 [archaeon]|nr:hypothetical protein [archaeon]